MRELPVAVLKGPRGGGSSSIELHLPYRPSIELHLPYRPRGSKRLDIAPFTVSDTRYHFNILLIFAHEN